MNKHLYRAAALVGLLAIVWVAVGYLPQNPLALAMTLLIGAFYGMGVLELQRYQKDTAALSQALAGLTEPPAQLADWLAQLPATLRHSVRLRLQGERSALAGPALTPYLAGLLVLLGMLGTFVGMVVTLHGTGLALERAADVQSMRDSLAAPVRGLGLAFGTSVAGVAASAMLGLMSALCRRGRQQAGQQLDAQIATTLQTCTRAHQLQLQRDAASHLQQRQLQLAEQALQAQQLMHQEAQQQAQQQAQQYAQQAQQQAQAMPLLADRLQALMSLLQQQSQQSQAQLHSQAQASHTQLQQTAQQLQAQLLASQQQFQGGAEQAYRALATSVEQTLQRSLEEAARLAAATQDSVLQTTMSSITRETAALHGHIASTAQQQLDGMTQRFEQQSGLWVDAVGAQVQAQTSALLRTLSETQAAQQAQQASQDQDRLAAWTAALGAMAQKLEDSSGHITAQAEAQARATVAEVSRLVLTAAEAPRAAADVVAQLRDKLSESLARDNAMLEERGRIMATLNTVLSAVQHTSTEQTAAIDRLVASTAEWLDQAGARFNDKVSAESARLDSVAVQLSASAVDVASLGEAFAAAVDQFSQSNHHTVAHLQRVEEALASSRTRSDEQLAYYVAQAREVIDLSLMSQKRIVDDLQRLGHLARSPATVGSEA
jgi:hypothetical protein